MSIYSEKPNRIWVFESLPDTLRKKGATLEAEYFAIITALNTMPGGMIMFSDSETIVRNLTLNNESKIGKKHRPYVETVRKLSQNCVVRFEHIKDEHNKADISSHTGIILEESVKP